MHIVECPHCHRKFRLPSPAVNKRMKCSRCGEVFVGSSAETPQATRQPAPPAAKGGSVFQPDFGPPQPPKRTSNAAVIMLVGCFFGVAAIIVLGVLIYYRATHPRVVVKDLETGRVERAERMSKDQAERLVQKISKEEAEKRRQAMRGPPEPAPQEPAHPDAGPGAVPGPPAPQIKGDPKLSVTAAQVSGGAVGEQMYVCGTVLSAYPAPLKSVTVTLYVKAARGPSRTYMYLPAEGAIRYTLSTGSEKLDEADMKVVATCKPAEENLMVWEIPSDDIFRSSTEDGKVLWSGTTRNVSPAPAKNVRIFCDYFAGDGVQGGSAVGGLAGDDQKIGIGESASFRIVCEEAAAELARILVARVVAEKH